MSLPRLLSNSVRLLGAACLLWAGPARGEGLARDAGRPMPAGSRVALIVGSPGLQAPAYDALVQAIEAEGVDAWLWVPALADQDLQGLLAVTLPAARRDLPRPDHALVGHGLGGTLAAWAALADPPTALALLGAPLDYPDSALTRWMRALPIPAEGVDLAEWKEVQWTGMPALELLLGAPLDSLDRVSARWLEDLRDLGSSSSPVDLGGLACPSWYGAGDMDVLSPAERVRPLLGPRTEYLRFGYLRADPHPFDNADLLRDARSTRALARWLADRAAEQR